MHEITEPAAIKVFHQSLTFFPLHFVSRVIQLTSIACVQMGTAYQFMYAIYKAVGEQRQNFEHNFSQPPSFSPHHFLST
jgi:hypothetical protein